MTRLRYAMLGLLGPLACGMLFAGWEPDRRLTVSEPDLGPSSFSQRWFAADGENLHVVWTDNRNLNADAYYKRSRDGGATWDADVNIVENAETADMPAVAASGQYVYVAWDDNRDINEEIYFRGSTDNGSTWGAEVRLSVDDAISRAPSVAAWQEHVYVIWDDGRTPTGSGVFIAMSSDAGATWTDDRELQDPGVISTPAIAVWDSMVHVVWADFREGTYKLFYKRSFDHGASWSDDTRLSDETGLFPSIAVSGTNVHVVYTDVAVELKTRASTDGGETWSDAQQISQDADASTFGSVHCDGPLVHVAWHENRYANESEIAYRRSQDGGATWEDEVRLTDAIGISSFPCLMSAGDMVHLIWLDYRDTWPEVYYKRNPDGNTRAISETPRAGPVRPTLRVVPSPVIDYACVPGHERETFVVYDAAGRPQQQCTGARIGVGLPAGVYLLRRTDADLPPVRFVKLR